MGFLKEKYTREYFTGRAVNGANAGYGALGADEWRAGSIFHEIRECIDLVELCGAQVLELGYGRGESARYMLQEKGVAAYWGVDFSSDALALARETLDGIAPDKWRLDLSDALSFMQQANFVARFDAVFMLDTIEHIPRLEVDQLLPLIHRALRPGGFLIVDTPFYGVDEDYIAQNYRFLAPSASDLHPATEGMHCNKFTRERVHREMNEAGFKIIADKLFRKPPPRNWRQVIIWIAGSLGRRLPSWPLHR